jgi:hypothetical protein
MAKVVQIDLARAGQQVQELASKAGTGPITMVNHLRYKAQADYGDRKGLEPCSGRDCYWER